MPPVNHSWSGTARRAWSWHGDEVVVRIDGIGGLRDPVVVTG